MLGWRSSPPGVLSVLEAHRPAPQLLRAEGVLGQPVYPLAVGPPAPPEQGTWREQTAQLLCGACRAWPRWDGPVGGAPVVAQAPGVWPEGGAGLSLTPVSSRLPVTAHTLSPAQDQGPVCPLSRTGAGETRPPPSPVLA